MTILCGDEAVAFVAQSLNVFPGCHAVGIADVRDGKIVSAVSYDKFCGNSIEANILVGTTRPSLVWAACILDYPFRVMGVGKMVAWVRSTNEDSMRFCTKLGFLEEGEVSDYYRDGSSVKILTLSPENCRLYQNKRFMSKVPR